MKVLVVGGTRYFGIHMVRALLRDGHQVTIATRGNVQDEFGEKIHRILVDRCNPMELKEVLQGEYYDVICDNIAYSSNEVKYLLEAVHCGRYILTSSVSVYPELGRNTRESAFNPIIFPLIWCDRSDYNYNEIKRQAECALFQTYTELSAAAIRFPYVIGEDDYTKRLYFYVEHILNELPMYVDNQAETITFIKSSEAGDFMSWIACSKLTGPINACSLGSITLEEVFAYIEQKIGKKPLFDTDAEAAPYNGVGSFSLDTKQVEEAGYRFSELDSWIYELLDEYILEVQRKNLKM
jgi:nucleoside-diphosphate-sugar epimerase